MLSQLYAIPTEEPRETPTETAMMPLARMVRDEWVTTFFRDSFSKDNWTQEDREKREEYLTLMLKEPAVSTAFWSLIASVMSLPLKVHAADPDDPKDVYWSNFVRDAIQSVQGGVPKMVANTAAGGLLFGFGVCEMVFEYPERGKWTKNLVLDQYAPLDSRYIKFDLDPFKRVRGVRPTKANGGQVFGPERFAIFSHQSLFGSPFGLSKFRPAYRAAKMMESAIKLRVILLQNFTGPFLVLKSSGAASRETAMRVLSEARALGYMVCDRNDEAEVLNMAAGSDSEFQSAIDDLRKEMYTAIRWGYLPFTEAQSGVQVGNSEVQKSMTQLGEWMLATEIAQVFTEQIAKPLIRFNCPDDSVGFPTISLGGQNSTDKRAAGEIFEQAKRLNVILSKRQVQRALDIEEPADKEDELRDPIQPGPGGGNPFMGQPGFDPLSGMGPELGGGGAPGGPSPDGGAPVPAGGPAPMGGGDPQAQPDPHDKVDFSHIDPTIGRVSPVEMDKSALVAALDLRAKAVSLGQPGRFQRAIDALRSMVGNHPAMHAAIMSGGKVTDGVPPPADQKFGWMPQQTRSGHVKAVGTGEHSGRTLYGPDAQRALYPQMRQAASEPAPTSGSKAAEGSQANPVGRSKAVTAAAPAETQGYQSLGKQVSTMGSEQVAATRDKLAPTPAVEAMAEKLTDHVAAQTGEKLKAGPAAELLHEHLANAHGLTDDQRETYGNAIDRVTFNMPDAAHARLAKHLGGGVTFHADTTGIGSAVKRDVLSISREDRHAAVHERFKGTEGQKFGGGYVLGKGSVHIDGGKDGASPHEVYAHVLGHAIDGPQHEISNSDKWWDAFASEIAMTPEGKYPLGQHAGRTPEDGFAEFSRLLYASDVPHDQIAAKFPRALAVFRSHGLLPDGFGEEQAIGPDVAANRPKPGRSTVAMARYGKGRDETPNTFRLPEIFGGRIDAHPDGSHIDVLAGKPQPGQGEQPPVDQPTYRDKFQSAHAQGDDPAAHDLIAEALQGKHGDAVQTAVGNALDEHYQAGASGGEKAKRDAILEAVGKIDPADMGDSFEGDLPERKSTLSAEDDPFAMPDKNRDTSVPKNVPPELIDDEFPNDPAQVAGADLLGRLNAIGDDGKAIRKPKSKDVGSDALHQIVTKSGGIDPTSPDFLKHFEGVNEAVEYGIPRTVFKIGGREPYELAKELHNEGHIHIEGQSDDAPDVDGTDHLFQQLATGAKSLHSQGDRADRAADENARREQEEAEAGAPWKLTKGEFLKQHANHEAYVNGGGMFDDPAEIAAEAKWRFPAAHAVKGAGGGSPEDAHRRSVETALREGRNVPANVLNDYPDLAPAKAAVATTGALKVGPTTPRVKGEPGDKVTEAGEANPKADGEGPTSKVKTVRFNPATGEQVKDDEPASVLPARPDPVPGEAIRAEPTKTKEPWEMTRSEFIASHKGQFGRYKGGRSIVAVSSVGGGIEWPLEKGDQRNGKLLKPPEEILGRIHEQEVRTQHRVATRADSPDALPFERWAKGKHVPPHVLADYPDLAPKAPANPSETPEGSSDGNQNGNQNGNRTATESGNPHAAHVALANRFAERFQSGEPITAREARDLADEVHGGTQGEGKYGPSDIYDSMEAGLNKSLKSTDPTADLADAQRQAAELADKVRQLPTQTNRSGTKDSFQQFSTPPHYAFAANWVANHQPGDQVLEPSAGTGSLAVHAANAGAEVHVNEYDPRRRAFLADLFGADKVHAENAEQIGGILPGRGVRPDTVVMNPPFSQTAGRMGDKKDLGVAGQHIREALATMKPGGRLVAIVGRGMSPDSPTHRPFFDAIKKNHELRANVGISGDEYKKYGTSFGTRMLVIDKTGKPHSGETVEGDAENIPHAMQMLEGVRNDRRRTGQPATGVAAGESGDRADAGTRGKSPAAPAPTRADVDSPTGREPANLDVPVVEVPAGTPAGSQPAPDAGIQGVGGESVRPEPGRDGATARGERRPAGNDVADPQGPTRPSGSGDAGSGKPKRVRKPADGEPVSQPARSDSGLRPPKPVELVAPEAAKTVGDKPQVAKGATAPSAEPAETKQVGGENSLFQQYRPGAMPVPNAKAHPTPLVESAAMAAVKPPAPTYRPVLSPDQIEKGMLSEAALESITYAGQAHEKMLQAAPGEAPMRRGYFIGDGTGAGKGRQVAGIIMDNMNQGRKKHVWITQKQPLYNDAHRDWKDIGGDPAKLFHFDEIKDGSEGPQDGIVFVTYDTLKGRPTDPTKPSNLDQLLRWLGPDFDGTLNFDEAHTMANAIAQEGERGGKGASARALAGVDLQKRLPNARVTYVSATGATDPSNLAYAERLGLWGHGTPFPNKQSFISEMDNGGLAAMEAVAQSLKAMGGYGARSLSPEGLTYDRLTHKLTPEQRGNYDIMADAWQKVLQNIDAAMESSGAHKNAMAKSAAKSQFWGAQQRFFNQVMTSMQTPSAIRSMEEDIARGHSPVVQLVNTMEAAAERAKAKIGEGEDLDNLDVSPKEVLFNYLQKSFPIHRYEEYTDEDGNERTRIVRDSQGNPVVDPAAQAIRDQLLSEVAMLKIPKSPIDLIIDHFGHENVSEATGRKSRFILKEGPDGRRKVTEDRRGKNANAAETAAFQGGKKKIMIFSDAGGTGSSYHADNGAVNNSQRVHYVLQPGWRADNAVQGLGRTHRTNQKTAPIVKLVEIEDLKGQKRFVSTIARRLDQLGALTRGQRQASSGLFSAADNLEGPQARDAMEAFFRDLKNGNIPDLDYRDTMRQLGLEVDDGDNDKKRRRRGAEGANDMGQFLNRLLSLRVDTQAKVFDAYEQRLNSVMEQAAANGELDTGVENFKALGLSKVKDGTVYKHPESGAEVRHLVVKARHKTETRSFRETGIMSRDLPVAYVRSMKTGKVFAVHEAADYTDAKTGNITSRYALRSPRRTSDQFRNRSEVLSPHGNFNHLGGFEKLPHSEAEQAWNEELQSIPPHTESEEHFLTGALLPIWNKIPGQQPKIYRLKTDDGQTTVGRHVPKKHVEVMLRNLGVEGHGPVHKTEDVFRKLRTGEVERASLSNGWNLKPSRVQDEKRIEVLGVDPYSSREWEQLGGIKHRIGYETRHFIPIGDDGHKVLDQVLKARNATITDVSE